MGNNEQMLRLLIQEKLRENKSADARLLAKTVFDSPEAASWLLEKLVALVTAEQRAIASPRSIVPSAQMPLPGFTDLGRKLRGKRGKLVATGDATITDVKENLKALKAAGKKSPAILRSEKLIAEMEPYAAKEPGLTVARFYELRAALIHKALPSR